METRVFVINQAKWPAGSRWKIRAVQSDHIDGHRMGLDCSCGFLVGDSHITCRI